VRCIYWCLQALAIRVLKSSIHKSSLEGVRGIFGYFEGLPWSTGYRSVYQYRRILFNFFFLKSHIFYTLEGSPGHTPQNLLWFLYRNVWSKLGLHFIGYLVYLFVKSKIIFAPKFSILTQSDGNIYRYPLSNLYHPEIRIISSEKFIKIGTYLQ